MKTYTKEQLDELANRLRGKCDLIRRENDNMRAKMFMTPEEIEISIEERKIVFDTKNNWEELSKLKTTNEILVESESIFDELLNEMEL